MLGQGCFCLWQRFCPPRLPAVLLQGVVVVDYEEEL